MRNFFNSHWKVIVAILIAIVLAMLTIETKGSASLLPSRLHAHAQALLPDAAHNAERHIATSLMHYGYAPRWQARRSIEATIASHPPGMQPSRIFIVGAHLGESADGGAAAVLELARALRDLRPATGTEIRFVFFMDERGAPRHRGGGNFLAYIGSRASAQRVGQALASFRSNGALLRQGLAAPAHVMGVTMSRGMDDGAALVLTDAGFLRFPYFRTGADGEDRTDYAAIARVVRGLAGTLEALAGPVEA